MLRRLPAPHRRRLRAREPRAMAELSCGVPAALAEVVRAQKRGRPLGIASLCSAHPLVLRAAFEQALEDGSSVLVESTSNQVNQEGGYTGHAPGRVRRVRRAGWQPRRGFRRSAWSWAATTWARTPGRRQAAAVAMARAAEMVRAVRARRVREDPPRRQHALRRRPAGAPRRHGRGGADGRAGRGGGGGRRRARAGRTGPVYVVGTEVPVPGRPGGGARRACRHARPEDAERTLDLDARGLRATRARAGLGARGRPRRPARASSSATTSCSRYRPEAAARPRARRERPAALVFEAHSTDYQDEEALRALVADHFAILKVGPELTFAFREAVFALEEIERELLGGAAPERLSGLRAGARAARCAATRGTGRPTTAAATSEDAAAAPRSSASATARRYYWPRPEVQDALCATLRQPHGTTRPARTAQPVPAGRRCSRGGSREAGPPALVRLHVRRVLARYARACGAPPGGSRRGVAPKMRAMRNRKKDDASPGKVPAPPGCSSRSGAGGSSSCSRTRSG